MQINIAAVPILSSPVSFWRPLLSVCTLGRTTILNKKQPDKKKKKTFWLNLMLKMVPELLLKTFDCTRSSVVWCGMNVYLGVTWDYSCSSLAAWACEMQKNPHMRSREREEAENWGRGREHAEWECVFSHPSVVTDSYMINCGICFQGRCRLYLYTVSRYALVMAWPVRLETEGKWQKYLMFLRYCPWPTAEHSHP